MKAIAKKIKDNEWIAEIYKGIVYEESDHTKYPIVSPSDKEWLEKNNVDGKEVEGYIKGGKSFHLIDVPSGRVIPREMQEIVDYLDNMTIPPIHSDPAGEGKSHEQYLEEFRQSSTPQTGREWIKASDELPPYNIVVNGRLKGKPALVKNSNLTKGYMTANGNLEPISDVEWLKEGQTGRTYTEGEAEDSKEQLIGLLQIITEDACYEHLDGKVRRTIDRIFSSHLKKISEPPKIAVYSREDCVFRYCDSPDQQCEKADHCHYNPTKQNPKP